jgi:diguanylate cyclase (GGDEF)-like protein
VGDGGRALQGDDGRTDAPGVRSPRQSSSGVATCLVGATVALIALATALPPTRIPAVLVATGVAAVALPLGIRLHRPGRRLPWIAATLMLWLWAVGIVVLARTGDRRAAGWFIEAGAVVAALMVGYLLFAWQRNPPAPSGRRHTRGEALGRRADQMVVGCTVALGGCQMAATALAPQFGYTTWATVIAPLDVVLACLLLRFAASRQRLGTGSVVAIGAALLTALYDMLATTQGQRVAPLGSWLSTIWAAAACLYAVASLHPSMADFFTPATLQSRRSESARLLGLAPLALAPVGLYAIGGAGLGTRLPVPMYLAAGALISVLAVVRGAQAVLTSERRAERDPLTGMANRRGLVTAFDRLVGTGGTADAADVQTGNRPLGRLSLLDVDDFKHVNDTFGHEAGDRLLLAIAERLREVVGSQGTVARSGGDEFVILLGPGAGYPEELLATAFSRPFDLRIGLDTRSTQIRASAGWAPVTAASQLAHTLAEADIALYAAKGAGKGGVCAFHEGLREDVLGRLSLVDDLRRLLSGSRDAGSLELRYQPLVSLADDRIVGCEVLLRWEHPERGLLPPDSFLPPAEQHGLAARIEVAEWDAAGLPEPIVSVNLGRSSMLDPQLADVVRSALRASGLRPGRLHLEITEHSELPVTAGVQPLWSLAEEGVRVSLDDFGIGYTSLDYVRRYPVSTLKLDRSITEPLQHETCSPLLRGVVLLAGSLGIEVLAEGIESGVQKERLRALGVQFGQGYALAHPLTAEDFRRKLDRRGVAAGRP